MRGDVQKNQVMELSIRPATIDDAKLLWEWANDLSVRQQSFNTEPIDWGSHMRWFSGRIASTATRFYLLLNNGQPVGQIRYDCDENSKSAEISFSIGKEHRGRRFGVEILRLTCDQALQDLDCRQITALVIKGNEISHKAFLSAGFEMAGLTKKNEKTAYKFVWKPMEN